jgi:hypothetical protein
MSEKENFYKKLISEVLSAVYEEILNDDELYYTLGARIQGAFTNTFRNFSEIEPIEFCNEIAPLIENEEVKKILIGDLKETKMDLRIIRKAERSGKK